MSLTEIRSELFSRWEKRLRGWDVYPAEVKLEPTFAPCFKDYAHLYLDSNPGKDDGRHSTILSTFADWITRKKVPVQKERELPEVTFPSADPINEFPEYTELLLLLPKDYKGGQALMQHILATLAYTRHPLSFEVIGTEQEIAIVLACSRDDLEHVRNQLTAHAPECVIDQTTSYLSDHWSDAPNHQVVDFGLEHEVMLSLKAAHGGHDPLVGITAALSSSKKGECGVLQILFTPADPIWSEELHIAVTDWDGSAFFADAPHITKLAQQKTAKPLCACVVRACGAARSEYRAREIVKNIGGTLMQFRDPPSNSLMPLTNDDYPGHEHVKSVLNRTSFRTGMLLNYDEIAALVHLPDQSVCDPKLKRVTKRTKAVPELTRGNRFYLGENEHRGESIPVTLTPAHRSRHMHLIGASGTGKSTMLLNMIIQDMQAGNGVAVLDPHGDLIDTLLAYVPNDRVEDVIVFDPSDEKYPIGFNIIDAHSELEKTLLASDLTSVFKRLSTSWGDQMNSVLANGISAMLESEHGGTLPILRRFLVDKKFRDDFLKTVTDPENVFYWQREFPLLSGKPQGPVLTRLDTFLRPKPIRHMVAQKENRVDFGKIMQGGKIFLARLSQGAIGTENSYLMGAFLVTKLNQIAFSRQELTEEQRKPFYLYIDEFHNFITPSMESILSGARKYNMSLILAHQELRQLEGKDSDVASSVISNPFTRVCFRLGDMDAKRLQSGFSFFEAQDLQSLGIGEAIARVERAEFDFNLATPPLKEIDSMLAEDKARAITEYSRQKYGTPREEVEQLIYDSHTLSKNVLKPQKAAAEVVKASTAKKPAKRGKGGNTHKDIQERLYNTAIAHGLGATIEEHIGEGSHIDLVINSGKEKIACEISVSTSVAHEVRNLKKCIAAGYKTIFLVGDDTSHISSILGALKKQPILQAGAKIYIFTPDEVQRRIENLEKQASSLVRGKKVSATWTEISADEQERKEIVVAKVLTNNTQ